MQREIMEIQTQWKSSVPDAKKVLVEKEQWFVFIGNLLRNTYMLISCNMP